MQDALFLHQHPSWSQRDLDESDQTIIDLLSAVDSEAAKVEQRERMKARAKEAAARRRRR